MTFNEALRQYRHGAFTDQDVIRCTGLSGRAYRELIKVGAVRTSTEKPGPGRVRVCDATTFKRLAVISQINQAGFSLAAAGKIAFFFPLDHLVYNIVDPRTILLETTAEIDPERGLPPRLKKPKADWFEKGKPAKADPENDWLIKIYDGRFVGCIYPEEPDGPLIYGDLRLTSQFAAWLPFHQYIGPGAAKNRLAKWQDPRRSADRIDPRFLEYKFEDHSAKKDALGLAAEAAVRSPLFETTINVSLAIRKALRRYLGLEPAIPDSIIGEAL